MELGQALHDRLPLPGMPGLKLIQTAPLERVWSLPSNKALAVALIPGLDLGQDGKSPSDFRAKAAEFNRVQSRRLICLRAQHGEPPVVPLTETILSQA